jgi:hypothetical protein
MMKKIFVAFAVAAFAVAASSASAATFNFTRDLTVGSTGADVVALQDILISGGHLVMPAGVSKGYFGGLTQAALAKWQAAHGVAPAAGYFGPKTRAAVALMGDVDTGNDDNDDDNEPGLQGGDGDITDFDILGNPSNETVDEDQSEEVLGFEFEADDSDLRVERVEVRVDTSGSTGTDNPWDVVESAALLFDGKEVASIDGLDDEDEWDEESTDDNYILRFEDVDTVVEEGEVAEFTVEFTAQGNLDSGDVPAEFTLEIPEDGVRAVNAEGIDVYAPTSDSDDVDVTFDQADAGDVELSINDEDNEDRVEFVDEDAETDGVEVLRFMFESDASSNTIEELSVDFATTTATSTSLATVIKNVTLLIDGEEVDSDSLTASSTGGGIAEFDDLDFEVEEDDEVEIVVLVDFDEQESNYGEGYEFVASVNGANMEIEDAEGDDVDITDAVTGGDIELRVNGMNVDFVSESSEKTFTGDDAGERDRGTYTIKFTVSAEGDDVYVDKSIQNTASPSTAGAGIAWATTSQSSGSTTLILQTFTASGSTSGDTATAFKVSEGNSRTFTLNVVLEAPGSDSVAAIQIFGINWDEESSDTTPDNYYTVDLEDFKTDPPLDLNTL